MSAAKALVRRRATQIKSFALMMPVVLALSLAACGPTPTSPPPLDGETVLVKHVIDGDTVELDDGSHVRYIGINTPERNQPFFEQAREANRNLVAGQTVTLVLDSQTTDQYGRILAYIWSGDKLVNLELVRLGYANAYTAPPNVRYSNEIAAAEQEAREAGLGLWASSGAPLKIQEIHFNAPGADPENPNGEWITIVNDGPNAVSMAGYTLKDEASHIYTFSAIDLAPGRTIKLHSGQGKDDSKTLYWGLVNDSVWSNDGDTAFLRDPQGRLVDSYSY
jgi:micrococcal nuclease